MYKSFDSVFGTNKQLADKWCKQNFLQYKRILEVDYMIAEIKDRLRRENIFVPNLPNIRRKRNEEELILKVMMSFWFSFVLELVSVLVHFILVLILNLGKIFIVFCQLLIEFNLQLGRDVRSLLSKLFLTSRNSSRRNTEEVVDKRSVQYSPNPRLASESGRYICATNKRNVQNLFQTN
jgi:hypothetical protein